MLQEGEKLGLWRHWEITAWRSGESERAAADVWLLGAWHPGYEAILPELQGRVGVLWTSSVGEMDMAGVETGQRRVEVEYLHRILQDDRISFIWFGDRSLAQLFPQKGIYAPYPLALPATLPPVVEPQPPGYMTLMCPNTLKKNQLNQLVAARMLYQQSRITLATNLAIPKLLQSHWDADSYEWLPDAEYKLLLAGARLNLCCSWAETFSYQSAEAALMGVPSVGTRTIPWLPDWAVCDEPNTPIAIAAKARDVLARPHAREEIRQHLLGYAEMANRHLRTTLARNLG